MQIEEFNRLLERRLHLTKSVLELKGGEYATEDVLHNFKLAASVNQTSTAEALWGMATKHLVSIIDLYKATKSPNRHLIDEKIGDMVIDLILLEAVLNEEIINKKNDFKVV